MRLVERDRELRVALRRAREERRVLAVGRARDAQRLDPDRRRPIRLDDERAPELLRRDQHVDRAAAEAAVRLGHGQRGQAQLGERAPLLVANARVRMDDRAPRVEAVALVEIAAQRMGELLLFFAESEVHGAAPHRPRIICAMMFFWISFEPP